MPVTSEIALRCRCGHLQGSARVAKPSIGLRFVCYCTDCQAFARLLERSDVLDQAGGTDIFQMPPRLVRLTDGMDALRCVQRSDRVLRWYSDCCKTPVGNTATSARFPIVAIIHSFMSLDQRARDEVLGPSLCRLYERSAIASLPPDAPPPLSYRVFFRRMSVMLGTLVRGLGSPSPFFDERTGAPRSSPRVIDRD